MRRDVFQAIADPTRRAIMNMIASEPLNVNSVAAQFDISRAAIYKHIKILTECGLINMNQQGRERYCEAQPEKLDEVGEWVKQYRKVWEARLDALETYLDQIQNKPSLSAKKNSKAKSSKREKIPAAKKYNHGK